MKISADFVRSVGEELASLKWNQTKFADKIGESRFWTSKLLTGKLVNITEDQVLRIDSVLNLDLLKLVKDQRRERDFGSDEFVQTLAEQMRSSAPAHEAFIRLFELIRENQLYVLPELDVRHLKSLGEEIHRLSENAEKEPVAAARVLIALLQNILAVESRRVRQR